MSSFLDRLNTSRYISPSGQIILFDFEELTRTNEKKATVQEIPFQDGGIIQQQGNAVIRYPIVAYIYGKDYDITADRLWTALREKGISTWNHPRWGEIKVFPISYTQTEKFIENTRFATFTIDFVEYKEHNSPISKQEQKSKFREKLDNFKEALSLDFLNRLDLRYLSDKSTAMKTFNELLSSAESGLTAINQTQTELANQYDTILRNINRVNGLIDDAETTIKNIISLNFLGTQSTDTSTNLFNAYIQTQNSYQATYIQNSSRENLSTALQTEVFSACCVGAMASIVMDYDFVNKPVAIVALNNLQTQFNSWLSYHEGLQNIFADNTVDEAYIVGNDTLVYLTELVNIVYSYILNQLYDLKIEQIIILDKEINPLTLSYELYGTYEKVDDLINDNELSNYELFLLPIGKEIKIYV